MTDDEIKYFFKKAENLIATNNFPEALKCYNTIIQSAPPLSHYYHQRGFIYQMLGKVGEAINDMGRAIELDPDKASYWWERGALKSYKLSIEKNINLLERDKMLREILEDYKKATELNPSDPVPWLDRIELNILSNNFYEAIGLYGECQNHINSKEYQLIRSWLGCIAVIFAEDKLEEDDYIPLQDKSIKLKKVHWRVSEIENFFNACKLRKDFADRCKRAEEIHKQFLDHFIEKPW